MDRKSNAVILSIIPGLGHLYLGYPGKAVMWFLLSVCSCGLLWPFCFISAWSTGKHTLQAEDLQAIRRAVENRNGI